MVSILGIAEMKDVNKIMAALAAIQAGQGGVRSG